jgi:hypothetical protein
MPNGQHLLVQPGKDGGLYLLDAEQLGRMYDREQAIDFCGTPDDECRAFWAGSFVTQPVVTEVDGTPLVIAAGFKFDATHPAGVVAYKVVRVDGEPRLQLYWRTPSFDSELALTRFRVHPGRPVLGTVGGEELVFIAEVGRAPVTGPGLLWGIRVRDGANVVRQPLSSEGIRYSKPLLLDDMLYVASCSGDATADGVVDAFRLEAGKEDLAELDGGTRAAAAACQPGGEVCGDEAYCERGPGDECRRPGRCRPRPASCEALSEPACGCDGKTYDNACEAARAGSGVLHAGACP